MRVRHDPGDVAGGPHVFLALDSAVVMHAQRACLRRRDADSLQAQAAGRGGTSHGEDHSARLDRGPVGQQRPCHPAGRGLQARDADTQPDIDVAAA